MIKDNNKSNVNKGMEERKGNKQENSINDVLSQLDEIENFHEEIQDDKNRLADAGGKLADALVDLNKNIRNKKREWPQGYNPLKPMGWKDKNKREILHKEVSQRQVEIHETQAPIAPEKVQIIEDDTTIINNNASRNKKREWPRGYNPLKPMGWKDKNKREILHKEVSQRQVEIHETQAPIAPEKVQIIENDASINTKSSRNKLPFNPLKPGARNEYMKRNVNKREQKQTAQLSVERQVFTNEGKGTELQNGVLQPNSINNEKQFNHILKDETEEIAKLLNVMLQKEHNKNNPTSSRGNLEDFDNEALALGNLYDIFEDNTIDVNEQIAPTNQVIDVSDVDEEDLQEQKARDIHEPDKKRSSKYIGKNPWLKKCYKEIDKTDTQMTALAIAQQFMNQKPEEVEGAKKINVVCSGDKYILQVITDSKEVKTYEISEWEWKNRKQDASIFENKKPQNKKVISMKKVLRVDKDNVEGELKKLEEYKNGLEYMREKLEPINSKRKWKTLKLKRSITTGEDKESLATEDKQELKEIRHNVNAINNRFSMHKDRKHEQNKEDIINKYAGKKQNKDNGSTFGL